LSQAANGSILHVFLLSYVSSVTLVQLDSSDSPFTENEGIMLEVTIASMLVGWQHGCLQVASHVGPGSAHAGVI